MKKDAKVKLCNISGSTGTAKKKKLECVKELGFQALTPIAEYYLPEKTAEMPIYIENNLRQMMFFSL
ncbi:10401_t:CDS:2 [Entrophospora sp. SA101]|nr:10401_t:CDS:2 [Entrophospora sp. SA101]